MSQAASGVKENRGTAPVLKRALTTSLHAIGGILHGRYQSTFQGRSGARPEKARSLWSSFTSGLSSVGHFITSAPGKVVHAAVSLVRDPVDTVIRGAKSVGSLIVAGATMAWNVVRTVGKAVLSAARAVFEFALKAVAAVWNAVFKFVQHLIVQFTQHETQVDKQMAQQDRRAEKQYNKRHDRKVYDERQLANTVAIARQSAQQQAQATQAASLSTRKAP